MMSATPAIGVSPPPATDFRYITETLGLRPGEAATFDAGSPFDFRTQARLFVPARDVPAPSGPTQQAWRAFAQEATQHLVTQAGGGALLLYTSRTAMNDAHRRLAPVFESQGLLVLKQDSALPAQLVTAFKDNGNAVLFGLRTFFEGIDIQGDALRLVVLDKLPFAVPTDILFKSRCSRVDQLAGRKVSFYSLSVPEMSLVLIQGFGRLIRHRDDRGVVAILDSRLTSKSYGAAILDSLPPAPVTTDIREVAAFLSA
jgi:ATP-dependent DNA helicase DinG